MIKVLVVDDHQIMRRGLRDLLECADDIRVVAECGDGSEVAAAADRTRPDVLLIDLRMPRVHGLTAARGLRAAQPEVRVIVLTGSLTAAAVREADELGVAGFLLKGEDCDRLADQVRTVAGGGRAWSPTATATLALAR